MVRRKVAVLVLQRLDCYSVMVLQPMFYGLRLLSVTRTFMVDYLVNLISVRIEEGGVIGS